MITISDLLNPDDATASVTVHTQYPSPGPLTTLPSSFESSIYAKRSSWPDLTLRLPGVTTLLVEPRCAFTAITPSTPYSSYRYPCSPSSSFTFPPREYGDHRPSLAPSEVCSLPSSDCSESYIKHPYHHTKDTFEKSPNLARRNTMSATDANAGKKKQHACPVCHRGFSRLYNLRTHMRRHSTSATVTSSVDSPPTPNTPASQSFISPSFPSPPTLSKYLCPFPACQLSFSRSHDLARHILTHTQERPYECARCGRRFARRDALRRHDKVKNGEIVCALEGRPKGSKKRMSV